MATRANNRKKWEPATEINYPVLIIVLNTAAELERVNTARNMNLI